MYVGINVPRILYERARERGVDLESLVLDYLVRELGLDPVEEASTHVEIAENMLRNGRELLDKGDVTQASEKLYEAAEECIKALSLITGLEEAGEARTRSGWTLKLLDSAARRLAERIGEDVLHAWDSAYYLHNEGFHEARLDLEAVKARIKLIEKLLEITRKTIKKS